MTAILRPCATLASPCNPVKWYYYTVALPGHCATNPMVMTINPTAKAAPRLIYLVTEDWYFLSHRLPMAKAAQQAGYDVHVLTNLTGHAAGDRRAGVPGPSGCVATGQHEPVRAPDHDPGDPPALPPAGARPGASRGVAADGGRIAGRDRPAACLPQRGDRVGLRLRVAEGARAGRAPGPGMAAAAPASTARARPRWCRTPTTARRCPISACRRIASSSSPAPGSISTSCSRCRSRAGRSPRASSAGCSTARGCARWSRPMSCWRAVAAPCGC